MRLAKFLAHAGAASRRGAERLIAEGRVSVGGAIVNDPARDVDGSEPVALDGRRVEISDERVVYVLHKPPGVVSTARDTHGRPTVVDLVESERRLYPVGRLDADTSGLLLLTDDGELADLLTHPRHEVPKTYRATVAGSPDAAALRTLREGVDLDDGPTLPAGARRLADGRIELTLREGRKRQVRRMCDAVGHRVIALERVGFGPLVLGTLARGAHRRLDESEVAALRDSAVARPRGPRAGGPRMR